MGELNRNQEQEGSKVALEDIHTELRGINNRLDEMNALRPRVDRMESDVEGHHRTLYGEDGAGGIVARQIMAHATLKAMAGWVKWGIPLILMICLSILGAVMTHLADSARASKAPTPSAVAQTQNGEVSK